MAKQTTSDDGLAPVSLVPASGDSVSADASAAELVERAGAEGVALTGGGGLLTDLMVRVMHRGQGGVIETSRDSEDDDTRSEADSERHRGAAPDRFNESKGSTCRVRVSAVPTCGHH